MRRCVCVTTIGPCLARGRETTWWTGPWPPPSRPAGPPAAGVRLPARSSVAQRRAPARDHAADRPAQALAVPSPRGRRRGIARPRPARLHEPVPGHLRGPGRDVLRRQLRAVDAAGAERRGCRAAPAGQLPGRLGEPRARRARRHPLQLRPARRGVDPRRQPQARARTRAAGAAAGGRARAAGALSAAAPRTAMGWSACASGCACSRRAGGQPPRGRGFRVRASLPLEEATR